MAASMLQKMGRFFPVKYYNCTRFYATGYKIIAPHAEERHGRIRTTNAYYVLLPEVPPDTPETNPIMRTHEYPKYSAISPDNVVMGCAKLAIGYDVAIGNHCESLKEGQTEKTFEALFDPIDKAVAPMNTAWNTSKHLFFVKGGDYVKAMERVKRQVDQSKRDIWEDDVLFQTMKELNADRQNLTDVQKNLLDKYMYEARMNGSEFPAKDRHSFLEILFNFNRAKYHFNHVVGISHKMFSQRIEDNSIISEMPKELLSRFAEDRTNPTRGPWKVTLNADVYRPFLQYCSDRMQRWNVWWAYNNRCTVHQNTHNLSNHLLIKEIRQGCKDVAKQLGYENYVDLAMQNRMAGSVDNVLNMLESLKSAIKPHAEEDLAKLQEFATSSGFTHTMQLWDLPYWSRRHQQHLFKLDTDRVAEYFPLPKVLNTLFGLSEKLFGITIKECTDEVDVWDQNVYFFKVLDTKTDEQLAAFYIDPFVRPGKKLVQEPYMDCGRDRSTLLGITPFSYLSLNLPQPFAEQPVLLNVEEVAQVFSKFGKGLQQLLTTAPYSDLSGLNNVEVDAAEIMPQFMKQLFYNKYVLKAVSGHVDNGEPLHDDVIDAIVKKEQYMNSFNMMAEMYQGAYDLELYINDDPWQDVLKEVWNEFIPMPLQEEDNHPCSMTSVFANENNVSVYSTTWSKMIAADVYQAFEEAGFEDLDKLAVVGKRLRETFLAQSGCLSTNDLFRRFRGRDPTQDAFIDFHTKPKET